MDKSIFRVSLVKPGLLLGLVLFLITLVASTQVFSSKATLTDSFSVPVTPERASMYITPVSLPPQGLYDSCVPDTEDCLNHLDVLAVKGFSLILNYGQLYGDTKSQLAYADRAHAAGIKVIWAILPHFDRADDWMITTYPTLAANSNCSDNYCLIKYFVDHVKDHPATWGYYIADEIRPSEYADLKKWSNVIREADPNHPRLLVTAGTNDPMEQYYWFYSYMSDVADIFGPDYYPYGYIESGDSLTRFTGATASHAQYWADKLGGESLMVLQVFSLARYSETPLCALWPECARFPTYEQMKAQRDQTIMNSHPAVILWWTYADILRTENPQATLDELAKAAFSPLPTNSTVPTDVLNNCPQGWNCEDIGNPSLKGRLVIKAGNWVLWGSGWDIWSTPFARADQFYYVWQSLDCNGYLSVGVSHIAGHSDRSKAGIMMRKSFDPVSPYYAVFVTSPNGGKVQFRSDFGQDTQDLAFTFVQSRVYLKIVRSSTSFGSYTSSDGISWDLISGSQKVINSLTDTLMGGMAVTSGDEKTLESAAFDHVNEVQCTP
jgi:hypothetical protein